jgi:murein DD-endopeptidase MepM/ murein hydrolase activator NlpD
MRAPFVTPFALRVVLRAALLLALPALLAPRLLAEPPASSAVVEPGFRILVSGRVRLAAHPPLPAAPSPARQETAPGKAAPDGMQPYTFFPQAGRLARDLFLYNGTDLDESGAIRDWECTAYTYNGHQGHDVLVRTFREVEVGVPVFAALDGVVIAARDGEPDRNTSGQPRASNLVALDHGGGHTTYYYHLALGSVRVATGQQVVAGQELGLTASSGTSSWPHLHFESQLDGRWYEPSSGACRAGSSQWRQQAAIARGFRVSGFYLTTAQIPFTTTDDAAGDLAPELRTGTVLTATQRIQGRIDMHNLPGGSVWRFLLRDPSGALVFDRTSWSEFPDLSRIWIEVFELNADFARAGIWRVQVVVNDALAVDAPLRVVAKPKQAANRPPNRIRAGFAAPPRQGEVLTCEVTPAEPFADPDYDLVRYRYLWSVKGKKVRDVTSAALSDHLRRDLVRAGDPLVCRVTPHDGRRAGKPVQARAKVKAAP